MGPIEYIIMFFSSYPILVSFLGGFFVGEEGVLALAVLSGQGFFDWWVVFVFAYLGLLTVDSMWFFVGRIKGLSVLKKNRFVHRNYQRAVDFMHHFSCGNNFLLILYSKFVYATRVAVVMYMGRSGMSYYTFFKYNAIVNFMWTCLAVLVGWGAGRGMSLFINVYNGFILTVTGLVVVIVLFSILRHFLGKMFFKK